MIFFPLLLGEVLKNEMPDHISLSSFHDSCTRYHGGKRKLNMRQGFLYCKGFEKMEWLRAGKNPIFFAEAIGFLV
jgi:hypothetical protein